MPLDYHPNYEIAEREFPQLLGAIDAAEKLLKKLRSLRNKGFANDQDLEDAAQARDLLVNVLKAGNWKGRLDGRQLD